MRRFVGMDVLLAKTAVCVLSENGRPIREAEVASRPEPLVAFPRALEGDHRCYRARFWPSVAMVASRKNDFWLRSRADGDASDERDLEGYTHQNRSARC